MQNVIDMERVVWFTRLAFGYYAGQEIPPMPKKKGSETCSVGLPLLLDVRSPEAKAERSNRARGRFQHTAVE